MGIATWHNVLEPNFGKFLKTGGTLFVGLGSTADLGFSAGRVHIMRIFVFEINVSVPIFMETTKSVGGATEVSQR